MAVRLADGDCLERYIVCSLVWDRMLRALASTREYEIFTVDSLTVKVKMGLKMDVVVDESSMTLRSLLERPKIYWCRS